jgi:hypothetical protein
MAKNNAESKSLLRGTRPLPPGIIAFRPLLARIAGDVKAGLFMSQVVYWYNKVRRPFYKTYDEWTAETCLTRHELNTCRKRWRDLGVLKECLKGPPPSCITNST